MTHAPAGRIHHLELNVESLQASLRFWAPLLARLGYAEYQRWECGASYRLEDTYLVFVEAEPAHAGAGYHRKRLGLNHLAFHAASRTQVDELTDWVRAAGYRVLYEDRHPYAGGPGYYALYCEDPNGFKAEFVAPPEGA
jgi:catechol 2,3-dioxygenase-like lactoylglutathione lyase family enzyme